MSKSAKTAAARGKKTRGFTDEEKAAMRDYIQEKAGGSNDETTVLTKIAQMSEPDRSIAKRVHAIVRSSAPTLSPRTWYGMPAYATPGKDGKVVCFFQPAQKFKARYQTLGFSDKAKLDDGKMWPVVYAITELTPSDEAKIAALVKKAAG